MVKPVPATGPILNNLIEGQGQPVVLIHGLATSMRDWESLTPALLTAGFQVCRVDLFGHGDSPRPGTPRLYTFKVVYGTLDEWIESLGEKDQQLFLIGHSMGGYMSLMYALRNPDKVRAITLIDPLFSLKQLPAFMIGTHRLSAIGAEMLRLAPGRLVDAALGRGPTLDVDFSPSVRKRIVADVKRASPYILNIPSTLPDLTDDLQKIEIPCQVIWGDRDGLLNPDTFPSMVSSLKYAIGHLITGRGHQPHLENENVNHLVIEFIKTNMLSKEDMLGSFGEQGEKLAWQSMLFKKYRSWLKSSVISPEIVVEDEVPETPAEQLSLEQKKALLMEQFEMQLDNLVALQKSSPVSSPEQFEQALNELRKKMDGEIAALFDDGVN